MIIDNLDIVRIALSEEKADAPARVHCHRPLAGSVALSARSQFIVVLPVGARGRAPS
jgi:hypothetical protein